MTWDTSGRRARLPDDWPHRVSAVKARDRGACQAPGPDGQPCPIPGREVDHIIPGDNHELDNLQLLCTPHHRAKSAAEGVAARPNRRRPAPRHPGLL